MGSQRQCMQWSVMISECKNNTYSSNNRWVPPSKKEKKRIRWITLQFFSLYCFLSLFFVLSWSLFSRTLSHLSFFVQPFSFLSLESIWQLLFFAIFWLALCFPMTPYFSSSFPLLSVRKGSPARVFVWWWDRFRRFCSFFIVLLSPSFWVFLPLRYFPPSLLNLFLFFGQKCLIHLFLTVFLIFDICWIALLHPVSLHCLLP